MSRTGFGYQSELEAKVAEAARRQYNKLKMQTKAEIRQTIDRLLVGDFIVSCWPQVVVLAFLTNGLALETLNSRAVFFCY